MCPPSAAVTTTEIYDQALKYSRDWRVPGQLPQPCYTRDWLAENIAVLERYRAWLASGGGSLHVIRTYHIPMAGHVLGLNHKPSNQLDPARDFQVAMDYIRAKGLSASWNHNCQLSLAKFRRFLLHERGQLERKRTPFQPTTQAAWLPDWLSAELQRLQRVQQRNWRSARQEENIGRFWSGHLRLWRYLVLSCGVQRLADLKRKHVLGYIDQRLASGVSVSTLNNELCTFHGLLLFLQEQDHAIPQALLRIPALKQPDPLPRFLTDEQVRSLRADFEAHIGLAVDARRRRDALLDRAIFYLLWQSGLRKGEVEELRLEDLDLSGRQLTVRRGKGLTDRTVFLTETVLSALHAYLAVRGMGPTAHVFLYRNQPLSKDQIGGRLKATGQRVGVAVSAHRLRHTCATQLLNAGCRVTSIQKFLGHKKLNTTMIYARAYDQTVAQDYFTAMHSVERRLALVGDGGTGAWWIGQDQRERLLGFVEQLLQPNLSIEHCQCIATQMQEVLAVPQLGLPDYTTVASTMVDFCHSPPI